jgi:uncharacterized protein
VDEEPTVGTAPPAPNVGPTDSGIAQVPRGWWDDTTMEAPNMIEASTSGVPAWVDLSTPDVSSATNFYRGLLGWTVEHHVGPMGDYHIGKAGDLEVGGMMQAGPDQQGMPAMWTILFHVADVDDTVVEVQRAGGGVLEAPFDLPDARLAIVADPTGALFGLISHPRPVGRWLSTAHGSVCWVELLTRDLGAAEAFYTTVFGWKAETADHGDTRYITYAIDGELVAGAMTMPGEVPAEAPSLWSVYFAVDDCAVGERRTEELGGEILRPTTEIGDGRFAVLADPQGATFQLIEYAG